VSPREGKLFATSDLHVASRDNREIVEGLWPESPADWLIVAGDVGETVADLEWALGMLRERFATVIWVPGNHELWTMPDDAVPLRGEHRYLHLVRCCRRLGVITPEDPFPIWEGEGGPVVVAPLFLLYDYTFRPDGAATKQESLARAWQVGVVCTDEFLLHPDPHPTREAWCQARVEESERRLADAGGVPSVLVSHYPLIREPTRRLRHPEFAQWCGTDRTADWHRRFAAVAVVYGHLHIPCTMRHDGVRFEEVSLGYPREWKRRSSINVLREVLPGAAAG
jgi:3',5'-cyclic AMP phosphodiesterase CpdA